MRTWFCLSFMALSSCVIVVPQCDDHVDCGLDEMCWQGSCDESTGRYWNVELIAADVGWVHPDGLPWDVDFSPPDLYAEFGLPTDACLTSYVPDSFSPMWYESCDFFIPDDPWLFVSLWDVDGATDELAAEYVWDGTLAFTDLARTAGTNVGYEDPSGQVLTWIRVAPL